MKSRKQRIERQDRLLRLMPEVRWRLRHIPGIHAIGLGAKEVAGEVTDDWAFRVYVDMKLPGDELRPQWRIPPSIKGIPTDVLSRTRTELLADSGKHRPLKGGSQVRNELVQVDDEITLAGTIGCLAELAVVGSPIVALSCEHVLLAGQATLGVKTGQPKYVISCCCCTYNEIGTVFSAIKNDEVDCAVIRLDEDIVEEVGTGGTLNEVEEIGTLTGVAQAVCFERVRKRGRTTELTEGEVVDVLYESNQVLVHPTAPATFADRGDSGAVLVNDADQVVGLLWATDAATRTKGVANHIGPVMGEMNIRIAGQDATGLTIPATTCASSSAGP